MHGLSPYFPFPLWPDLSYGGFFLPPCCQLFPLFLTLSLSNENGAPLFTAGRHHATGGVSYVV